MKIAPFFAILGTLPAVPLCLGSDMMTQQTLSNPTSTGGCACNSVSVAESKSSGVSAFVVTPACPASLEELCTLTSTSRVTWCRAGGLLFDCEEPNTNNDGDSTFGERHFLLERFDRTYHCATGNYTRCGTFVNVKIGTGSKQDECCSTYQDEPPCPSGSCK